MSTAAAADPRGGAIAGAWREQGVALSALLRRDLLGGSRGAGVLWARGLAALVSGAAALMAFGMTAAEMRNEVAALAAATLFVGLLVLGFVLAIPVAVSSLRREREAGMLELLLLAGIRPWTLALGRVISSWLFLCSLLLAALPGLALLWFYRRPSFGDLALATTGLAMHFLALAAMAVAISAWARHAGYAIALCIVGFGAWMIVLGAAPTAGWPAISSLLIDALLGDMTGGALPHVTIGDHATGAALDAGAGLLGIALAARGLSRPARTADRDRLRERIDRKGRRLRSSWSLTWLLQRRSAPARPAIQALLVVPAAACALAGGPEACSLVGGLLVAAGLIAAAALGATAVAPERERRAWESIAATGRESRAITTDLLRGILSGSAVPLVAGLALTLVAMAPGAGDDGGTLRIGWVAASIVLSWVMLAVMSLAASVSTSRASVALAAAAALALAEPILGHLGLLVSSQASGGPLEGSGLAAWLMLVSAAAFLGTWLVSRAGWRGPVKLVLAFVPTILLSLIPIALAAADGADDSEGSRTVLVLSPFIALGGAGAALLAQGLRRSRGLFILAGIALVASCVLVPLFGGGLSEGEQGVAAWGGMASPLIALDVAIDGTDVPSLSSLCLGGVHHAILLWAILATFLPRLDRMLGRAG